MFGRGLILLAVLGACATSDGSATVDAGFVPVADAASEADSATDVPDAASGADAAPDASVDAAIADASVADAPAIDAALPPDAMPDAMLPPDAMPDAMLPPDACVPGWTNLLVNGGFEQMTTGWTQTGTVIRQFSAGNPWAAFEGSWATLFGGINNATHQLTQVVTVPAGATGLRLRGRLCFVTQETTTTSVFDTLTVQVQGTVIEEYVFSNLDAGATCSWTSFQLDAPSSHAGETITLSFAGSTDISLITSFALDALFLEALACP